MTPERWRQIEAIYHKALERPVEERADFVAEACGGDEELRAEVESFLHAHERAESFIETPPEDLVAGMVAEAQTRSMPGRTLGHYRIEALLGAGGMGEVYRARDLRLERAVAVKILPEELAENPEALRRFEREAKAVAALSHPNILAIFDFGTEEGISYAVMELLQGETLRERLRRGPIPWPEAVEIAIAVSEGLAAAHAKGIIHRDLKPENLFLTSAGPVKILDFGIARVVPAITADSRTLTEQGTLPGAILGTVGYISPEQLRGEPAEAPSDLFALGCVLYEMLGGKRPFVGATPMETAAEILWKEPPPLSALGNAIPAALGQTLRGCLEKRAADRLASARDLARSLRTLSAPARPSTQTGRSGRRAIVAGAFLGLLLLASGAWWFWPSPSASAIDSLAVIPLANASGDESIEFLSEEITDALINSLSQLPQLKRVIARSTVASYTSYKGKNIDPRVIGRDLNVRSVLMGRIAKRGDDLLIGAELVNTEDGARLWGDSLSRGLADAMLIQAELARQIADNLRLRLTGAERQRLVKRTTENPDAYRLYVTGRHYSQLRTLEGAKKGIDLLSQAVRLDPGYALAYAGLADCYYNASSTYAPAAEVMPKVRVTAEQALQLDESLAEAHTALAQVRAFYEWNWAEGEKEVRRSLELNPGYARANFVYGMILAEQGRLDEAIRQYKRANELDPLSGEIAAWIPFAYYLGHRYEESMQESRKRLASDPNFLTTHINLMLAYEQQGRFREAEEELGEWKRIDPGSPYPAAFHAHLLAVSGRQKQARALLQGFSSSAGKENYIDPYFIALIHTALGEKDAAFAWLEKAIQAKSEDLLNMKTDPRLDPLRGDPRFAELMRRLHLAP